VSGDVLKGAIFRDAVEKEEKGKKGYALHHYYYLSLLSRKGGKAAMSTFCPAWIWNTREEHGVKKTISSSVLSTAPGVQKKGFHIPAFS